MLFNKAGTDLARCVKNTCLRNEVIFLALGKNITSSLKADGKTMNIDENKISKIKC